MEDNDNSNDNDSASVESENRYYDPIDLDLETLAHLKNNDLRCDSIMVTFNGDTNPNFGWDPLSIDWENEGSAIAENSVLRMIEIRNIHQTNLEEEYKRNQETRVSNAKAFYRAVAANRSIRYLTVEGNITYGLEMEDVIPILRPFVEKNSKLRYLDLGHITLDSRTAQMIASSLLSCTPTLSSFGLTQCDGWTERILKKILNALGNRPNINTLGLRENDFDDDTATLLGESLVTHLNGLKSLTLAGDYEMTNGSIPSAGMEAVAKGLTNNSTLENLCLCRNYIGIEGGMNLVEAISNNSTLKELNLTCAVSPFSAEYIMSQRGWEMFFEYLKNCRALCRLELGGNTIEDDDIAPMVESLNSMRSLTTLDLWGSAYITPSGWATFFRLLKDNTSLQSIKMHAHSAKNQDQRNVVYTALANTLCDKTSIESIINSNHTLSSVEGIYYISASGVVIRMSPACDSLLRMNKNEDKVKVTRQKIMNYFVFQGNNLSELTCIEVGFLPRVLQCVGKTKLKFLYKVVCAMPSLITSSLVNATGKALRGKRKRRS